MDQNDEKALADIEKYGCHILHVLEEENLPRFSYSIGIEKSTGHPEIIVTGLKRDLAHSIINEYNKRVRNGEIFEPNKFYDGFLGDFEVTFKEVLKENYKEYYGWGLWLYSGDEFSVLQMIYPSTSGKWPWDTDAPDDFLWFLPNLHDPNKTAK